MENKGVIRECINGLLKNKKVKGFKVSTIKKKFAEISEDEIIEILDEFVDEEVLEKECEVFCSYCHSMITSFSERELEQGRLGTKYYFCKCGRDVDFEDMYIFYSYKKI